MKVEIYHHPDTVIEVHGPFNPTGESELVETLEVAPTGKPQYSPETGAAQTVVLDEWTGRRCGVKVIERPSRADATQTVVKLWISSVDRDDVEHTQELPLHDVQQFGYLTVTID